MNSWIKGPHGCICSKAFHAVSIYQKTFVTWIVICYAYMIKVKEKITLWFERAQLLQYSKLSETKIIKYGAIYDIWERYLRNHYTLHKAEATCYFSRVFSHVNTSHVQIWKFPSEGGAPWFSFLYLIENY